MNDLKLIALDADDLNVISAHLQDAVLKIGDIAYLPGEQRLAAICNRFDWVEAEKPKTRTKVPLQRRRCAIRFERVLSTQLMGIDLKNRRDVLSLLAIQFEIAQAPGGFITLSFSGGGAIRLSVECIEAELRDLGGVWKTDHKPAHPGADDDEG